MKIITLRQITGFALFAAVLIYALGIFKLFTSGWVNNVTVTTVLVTSLILGAVAVVLWNLVANFINSKKEVNK